MSLIGWIRETAVGLYELLTMRPANGERYQELQRAVEDDQEGDR